MEQMNSACGGSGQIDDGVLNPVKEDLVDSRLQLFHEEYDASLPFGRIFEKTLEITEGFPTLPEKEFGDRQGLLLGQARLLGTYGQVKTCPYNESHRVSEGRYMKHILNCRKMYPEKAVSTIVCEYDASHHIPEEVYGAHVITCWSRNEQLAVEKHLYVPPNRSARGGCKIKLFNGTSAESKESSLIVTLPIGDDVVNEISKYKYAEVIGPPVWKSTKYTCWL